MLDTLGAPEFWDRPLEAVLADWLLVERSLGALPHLRHLLCSGGLSYLLRRYRPGDLVRAAPAMLAPVANWMCASGSGDEGIPPDAGALVRDALIDGHRPSPADFEDARLADLLAEDETAVWLACLGALRRLWVVPAAGPAELTAEDPPVPEDDDDRARQFWDCLRNAVSRARDDPQAVAARKRMKVLHPGMHALYMRHGVRRE